MNPLLLSAKRAVISWTCVQNTRTVMTALSNNPLAFKKAKRLGRGPSSGKGKTSGRGQDGQHKRESNAPWFEGGQTPMHKLLPRVGFHNRGHKEFVKLNLSRVEEWVKQNRLDPTKPITMKELLDSRACHGIKEGVKLLGNGKEKFSTPIHITVSAASRAAIKAVEAAGGSVVTKYYNRLGLRKLLRPQYFKRLPLDADPVSRRELAYYRNPEVRGYLSK